MPFLQALSNRVLGLRAERSNMRQTLYTQRLKPLRFFRGKLYFIRRGLVKEGFDVK
jgi:hypothetical protein